MFNNDISLDNKIEVVDEAGEETLLSANDMSLDITEDNDSLEMDSTTIEKKVET
jgi:hypothetical protein